MLCPTRQGRDDHEEAVIVDHWLMARSICYMLAHTLFDAEEASARMWWKTATVHAERVGLSI